MQAYVLPTIEAILALNRGDGKRGAELLKPASDYELAKPPATSGEAPKNYGSTISWPFIPP
jgi:hypothetical protein